MIRQGSARKDLTGLFSTYTANDSQFLVTIDREKAKSLHIPLQQITDTLGIYMGSAYVNDFDFNNRSYRVYVQADQQFRAQPNNIKEFYVRSDSGAMIPLDNLVVITQTTTPQVISHYNLFRSAEIEGSAAPGFSSGQGLDAMADLSKKVLPQGFSFQWTGLSLEELSSGSTTVILFGLGTLVVYLTLSAQYESFALPFIVLLAAPTAMVGALGAQSLRGLQNDVYCQIGLVMLVGLSSKNAILIVEFAEQSRHRGMPLLDAAVEAAKIRLPAILMTSFAFILSSAAGGGVRRGRTRASFGRDHSVRRNDRVNDSESVLYSGPVSDHRGLARTRKDCTGSCSGRVAFDGLYFYFVIFSRAAPSTWRCPDCCTKAITRRLLKSVLESSLTCTSCAKLLPISTFPTLVRLCTTPTWVRWRPPFSPRSTCDSA
jgi:hypothetical protein